MIGPCFDHHGPVRIVDGDGGPFADFETQVLANGIRAEGEADNRENNGSS
jgi:hypothetical protein